TPPSLAPITAFSTIPPGTTYTLTTGVDVYPPNGTVAAAGDVVIGTLTSLGTSTLNPGDSLAFAGGTLSVVDTVAAGVANELAGVLVSGPFVFQVQDVVAADA